MRNPFFADPPKAIGWRSLPGHLLHQVKSVAIQVWQIFIPFESEPKAIPSFPEAAPGAKVTESTIKQCQWIFDQTEQRRNQLEQKAQSTFSLMVFLVPVLTSVFVYVVGKAKSGVLREITIGLVSMAGVFILLGFISAIRAVGVKSNQTLSLDSVIEVNGAFRSYDEAFHAKGLLYCASINTAKNDHLAQFVRGAHSMTAIAVIFVILGAIPTSYTAATQREDVSRTAIVGTVQVMPASSQSDEVIKDENAKLNARVQSLESRIAAIEATRSDRRASGRRRSQSIHPQ
jgi:hypothetical protein